MGISFLHTSFSPALRSAFDVGGSSPQKCALSSDRHMACLLNPISPIPPILPIFLRAAHNAARAASESLVMNETRVHVVITDVRRSDPLHASSVVNVPSRAGQARFRAAALSQRCSFVNGATRSLVCGTLWLPNLCKKGEGQP
jgi:hypothetical protein